MKIQTGFTICALLAAITAFGQRLEKIWETEPVFKVPESVMYDVARQLLYVSNIDGASNAKDGKGSISKVKPDGTIVSIDWVTGLHAPKGMAQYDNFLYVADVDAVITIDKRSGDKVDSIPIPGAKFLNDMTVDAIGTLYVSDSETGIIHKIVSGEPSKFITGRTRPNGLLWHDDRLFFVDAGTFYARDFDETFIEVATGMEKSTDGIEAVDKEQFLISSWVGALYLVNANGKVTELLNTMGKKINSADIGYDPIKRIVYVPTFSSNTVVAYKLVLGD